MHTQAHHAGAMAGQEAGDGRAAGVSWGAVFAGAAAAAALSFILLILGLGLGLSSISPYQYNATPLGGGAIAWVAFMQLAGSGIGGYLAGRLRVKWTGVHGDEVHFRDTAHGLLAWAVATLVAVAVLGGGARAVLGGAIEAGADDRGYLAQLIASRTGMAPPDAGQRVDQVYARAAQAASAGAAAEEARRVAAKPSGSDQIVCDV